MEGSKYRYNADKFLNASGYLIALSLSRVFGFHGKYGKYKLAGWSVKKNIITRKIKCKSNNCLAQRFPLY